MRQCTLDTETTGFDVETGHRVVDVGVVELVDRRATGRTFHKYVNPGRAVDTEAAQVHGLTDEFLATKPRFAEIADEFLAFLDGAELLIHNADFDVGFLNAEFRLAGRANFDLRQVCAVVDTLALARDAYPGQRNSLDTLCRRLNIDLSGRTQHGALLDAQLLADAYLAMTGGQAALILAEDVKGGPGKTAAAAPVDRPSIKVLKATDQELADHERRMEAVRKAAGGESVWPAGE
jgi:DNA polymerase-3 subunit epsilon